MNRRVLLLAPAVMPQAREWRAVIERVAGQCTLATFHPTEEFTRRTPERILLEGSAGPGAMLRGVLSVRSLVRRGKFDIVLAYYLTSYALTCAFAIPGRYVAISAGSDLFPSALRRLRRGAARLALRRASGAVAWTQEMSDAMQRLGMPERRILVHPRGIDVASLPAAASVQDQPVTRVISTRRLRKIFRHDALIEAFHTLVSEGRDMQLSFVGDGTERQPLEELVQRRGLSSRVQFVGSVSQPEVLRHLQSAHVFVSLSRSDGLSTSVVEAMGMGLLPVVSDIESNRVLIRDQVNGLLVNPEIEGQVEDALRRAAGDTELRARAAELNCRTVRDRYDIIANTSRILDVADDWLHPAAQAATSG